MAHKTGRLVKLFVISAITDSMCLYEADTCTVTKRTRKKH